MLPPYIEIFRPFDLRAAMVLVTLCSSMYAGATDISGRWLTFDLDSGRKRSIVEISRADAQFRGHIVELYLEPDEPPDPVCESCSGAQHNQRIRGMEILILDSDANGSRYKGKILDPEEGQLYKCVATPDATGKQLSIRAYVGISFLGRNMTWKRIE
jgi:uncharacterized protein (DUF2147 family)